MKKLKSFCSKLPEVTSLAADTCGIKVIPWKSLSPKHRLLSVFMALGIWAIPFLEPQLVEVKARPMTTLDSKSFEFSGLDLEVGEPVSFKSTEFDDPALQAVLAKVMK
ncbi:hypothetical protein JNK13_06725 [bacterium]|nr:hypothetical protein [bacterium]